MQENNNKKNQVLIPNSKIIYQYISQNNENTNPINKPQNLKIKERKKSKSKKRKSINKHKLIE